MSKGVLTPIYFNENIIYDILITCFGTYSGLFVKAELKSRDLSIRVSISVTVCTFSKGKNIEDLLGENQRAKVLIVVTWRAGRCTIHSCPKDSPLLERSTADRSLGGPLQGPLSVSRHESLTLLHQPIPTKALLS